MRIHCNKTELQKCVNDVVKAVPVKSPVYYLEGIKIQAKNDALTLYGSDGTLSIKCTMQADIAEPGEVVLTARILSELLAKFDAEEIALYTEGNNAVIECGSSRATLCFLSAEQYPAFPEYSRENMRLLLARQFVSMVNQTVFATSVSEDKPILTGILLECEDSRMRMVALDGYRLAIREEMLTGDSAFKDVVVPAKSMREVAHIIPDDDTPVYVYTSEKMVAVVCDNVEIVTRVLQGDYVKYRSILPTEHATRVIISRQALHGSLERASILARQSKTNLVNLKIEKDLMTITSDSEVGKVREEIGIRLTGKNLDIAFNARYLLDVLKEVEDEEIVMDFNTSISPCVIHPIKGESYFYLVLPVKTNTVS
jgi:DNA polymerase-3 subunit beta